MTATSRVRSESSAPTASGGSSPVAGSKSAQRTVAPAALGGLHPRADVRVVVEAGHDDLVARRTSLRDSVRDMS